MNRFSRFATLNVCVDPRLDGLGAALRDELEESWGFYRIGQVTGVGVFTGVYENLAEGALFQNKLLLEATPSEEVFVTAHGTSEYDCKGCAGYIAAGFEDRYNDLKSSREFSLSELDKSSKFFRSNGISVPIRTFYFTFGCAGEIDVEFIARYS